MSLGDNIPDSVKKDLLAALINSGGRKNKFETSDDMPTEAEHDGMVAQITDLGKQILAKKVPKVGDIVYKDPWSKNVAFPPIGVPGYVIEVLDEPIRDLTSDASGTIRYGDSFNVRVLFYLKDKEVYITDIISHEILMSEPPVRKN